MLESLIELIRESWEKLSIFTIVDEFEDGIVLRKGVYNRRIPPGLSWKAPIIEEFLTATTAITTLSPCSQTLTTKDLKQIVVSTVVKYHIKDVKPYLLRITDQDDLLDDIVSGEVQSMVSSSNYAELFKDLNKVQSDILTNVRKELNEMGFKIHKITFRDIGGIKSLRLLADN